jgi:hypothetical protein
MQKVVVPLEPLQLHTTLQNIQRLRSSVKSAINATMLLKYEEA